MNDPYRIIRSKEGYYLFSEIYYENNEMVGWGHSRPYAESDSDYPVQELRSQLCGMLLALSKPVLDEKKLLKKVERNIARDERKKEKLKKK